MTTNLPTIVPFKGDRVDLHTVFIPQILRVADAVGSVAPKQLLWEILTPEERAQRPDLQGFTPLPAQPPAEPITQQAGDVARWTEERKTIQDFNRERSNFRTWVMAGISQTTQIILSTTQRQFSSMTVIEIIARLRQAIGPLTSQDVDEVVERTKVPFQMGQSVSEFIEVHANAHWIQHIAGVGPDEASKVRAMKVALTACPAYEEFVRDFEREFRAVGSQNFETICSRLRDYKVPTKFMTPSSLSAARASAVTPAKASRKPVKLGNGKASNNSDQGALPTMYCYTHGRGFHDSKHCTERGEGHQEEATMENRLGGSTYKVPKSVIEGAKFDSSKIRRGGKGSN